MTDEDATDIANYLLSLTPVAVTPIADCKGPLARLPDIPLPRWGLCPCPPVGALSPTPRWGQSPHRGCRGGAPLVTNCHSDTATPQLRLLRPCTRWAAS
jgi:hypothetical protein